VPIPSDAHRGSLRPRTLPTESAALADVWAGVRREADAQGVPERGVQFVTRLRARLDAVASRARQQPGRPRVACLVGLDPPGVPGAWVGELIAWAGGQLAPGTDGGGPLPAGPDELERADPDVIIFASTEPGLAAARDAARSLLARPGWSALRAVREGRAYVTEGDAGRDHPGPQVAEALEALAEILHPTAFRFGHEGRTWARVDGAGVT
jgi:iron complex transport system substrate-binding protein